MAFYGFTAMEGLPALQQELKALAEQGGIRGTILLAEEGVNGTISGSDAGVTAVLERLRQLPGLGGSRPSSAARSSRPSIGSRCG